jgi:hypothetical protein
MKCAEGHLTVLARELDRDAQTLPGLSRLGDVIADLLGRLRRCTRRERSERRQRREVGTGRKRFVRAWDKICRGYHAERADLRGKSGTTRHLTAGDTAVDCKKQTLERDANFSSRRRGRYAMTRARAHRWRTDLNFVGVELGSHCCGGWQKGRGRKLTAYKGCPPGFCFRHDVSARFVFTHKMPTATH